MAVAKKKRRQQMTDEQRRQVMEQVNTYKTAHPENTIKEILAALKLPEHTYRRSLSIIAKRNATQGEVPLDAIPERKVLKDKPRTKERKHSDLSTVMDLLEMVMRILKRME